jgi:hypothetical protein
MFLRNSRLALASSASILLLAGCSGGGSSNSTAAVPQLSSAQRVRQAAAGLSVLGSATSADGLPPNFHGFHTASKETSTGTLSTYAKSNGAKIFVSDAARGAIYIFNATTLAPVGTITSGIDHPLGNFTDPAGDLYVANEAANTVTVYPLGATTPSETYSTGLSQPVSVAVGSDGTVYVAEFAPGAVVEYDPGSTTPARTLTLPYPEGVALDSNNNLYVSYNDPNAELGEVQEFAPKSTTGTNLGISVEFSGDVKLDRHDNLILEDQSAQTIGYYAPGTTTPYGTIMTGVNAYKLALNKEQCRLYVADYGSAVPIFLYKNSGQEVQTISGLVLGSGVSITPIPPT